MMTCTPEWHRQRGWPLVGDEGPLDNVGMSAAEDRSDNIRYRNCLNVFHVVVRGGSSGDAPMAVGVGGTVVTTWSMRVVSAAGAGASASAEPRSFQDHDMSVKRPCAPQIAIRSRMAMGKPPTPPFDSEWR